MTDENVKAKEVIKFLSENYGITPDDLIWWRDYHRSIQKYGDWIAKTVVSSVILAILSGIGFVVWEGIKHIIHKGA